MHPGFVLTLFVTLPFGKMVHGIHRFPALVRDGREREQAGETVTGETVKGTWKRGLASMAGAEADPLPDFTPMR